MQQADLVQHRGFTHWQSASVHIESAITVSPGSVQTVRMRMQPWSLHAHVSSEVPATDCGSCIASSKSRVALVARFQIFESHHWVAGTGSAAASAHLTLCWRWHLALDDAHVAHTGKHCAAAKRHR